MAEIPDISRMLTSDVNKKYLDSFKRNLQLKGLKDNTIKSYLVHALPFLKEHPDFLIVTSEDIENYYLKVSSDKSDHTVWDEILALKMLAKCIRPDDVKELFKNLKIKRPRRGRKLMPTWEDIKTIVNFEQSTRYKAIIMILWDAGPRITELTKLRIKDVILYDDSAILQIYDDGKSLFRDIPIIDSVPYLMKWLEDHPFKDDPEAPLFVATRLKGNARVFVKEPLSIKRIQSKLQKLGKDAEVENPVNPHAIRKATATRLSKHLSPAELEAIMGWVEGSQIANQYYIKVDPKELMHKRRVIAGIAEPEELEETDQPRKCPRCKSLNPYDAQRCSYCRLVLDPKLALDIQRQEDERLKQSEQIQQQIAELMTISQFQQKMIKDLSRQDIETK